MPSQSLIRWESAQARDLDEFESAHQALGGTGRGRRYATRQVNQAYTVLLTSQFQAFCRDLHSESVDYLVGAISPTSEGGEDLAPVEEYLKQRRSDPPIHLVRYLTRGDWNVGFRAVVNGLVTEATAKAQILDDQKILSREVKEQRDARRRKEQHQVPPEVISALNRLSGRPEWWARLYVAKTIERVHAFEISEVRVQLENDPNK